MTGEILIGRNHGRLLKTYGVRSVGVYNMKLAFVCLVIVVSWLASASGDLGSYPGLRFNFNNERTSRFKKLDRSSYYPNVRFKLPLEEYENDERNLPPFESLPETIRQLREIINWEKEQLNEFKVNRLKILRNNPVYRFDVERAAYREITKPDVGYQRNPILDEARMYPQDDDFAFESDEESTSDNENALDQPALVEDYVDDQKYDEPMPRTTHHEEHVSSIGVKESFPGGRFAKAKVVANPNEFAYAPPNPMFYRTPETPAHPVINNQQMGLLRTSNLQTPSSVSTDNVKVIQRSEVKYGSSEEDGDERDSNTENNISSGGNTLEVVAVKPEMGEVDSAGVYIIAVVAGISAAATVGLIAVGIGWYNLQKHGKNGGDIDYPAYGITGPNKDLSPTGERRLAQSAQMYHYQHQKQQIISMERVQPGERHGSVSEAESEEENEEGDYTVYECPGLAPTGEMEVKNPLFQDDPTPAQATPARPNHEAHK